MAHLPIFTTTNPDLSKMQTRWASLINPVLSNNITQSYILKNISLTTGDNTINHLQDKVLNGYLIIGMHNAYAQVYDKPSDMPKLTLILNASAPTVIDLMVF